MYKTFRIYIPLNLSKKLVAKIKLLPVKLCPLTNFSHTRYIFFSVKPYLFSFKIELVKAHS